MKISSECSWVASSFWASVSLCKTEDEGCHGGPKSVRAGGLYGAAGGQGPVGQFPSLERSKLRSLSGLGSPLAPQANWWASPSRSRNLSGVV